MNGFYQVVEIAKFGNSLSLRQKSFRSLDKNEILIKVHCTPINIADILLIKGNYGEMQKEIFPIVPGIEGSGEIVEVGLNIDRSLIGKRATILGNPGKSLTYDGLWAEYHYTTLEDKIMIFENEVDFEKICFLINPLTAIGMLDILRKKKLSSVIITAGAGTLGKMLIKLCESENIQTISLVKNKEEENILKIVGARNILRLDDSECYQELRKLSFQLKTSIAFDCLGGDFTFKILSSMVNSSTIYHFGNLEEKDIRIFNSLELIYKDKTIKGFWLYNWLNSIDKDEFNYYWGYLKSELQAGSKEFETHIAARYDFEEIDFAITDYQMNMSKGKVVIEPYRIVVKKN